MQLKKSLVLVGMMGAGKTAIGRRLAKKIGCDFSDADSEIARAANMEIGEIFAAYGEAHFRAGEKRVIARLLAQPPHVIATGGGAFMAAETRALIQQKAVSIWLKVGLDELERRLVGKTARRPLLQTDDLRATLERLTTERAPIYAEADITIASEAQAHDAVVAEILAAL